MARFPHCPLAKLWIDVHVIGSCSERGTILRSPAHIDRLVRTGIDLNLISLIARVDVAWIKKSYCWRHVSSRFDHDTLAPFITYGCFWEEAPRPWSSFKDDFRCLQPVLSSRLLVAVSNRLDPVSVARILSRLHSSFHKICPFSSASRAIEVVNRYGWH